MRTTSASLLLLASLAACNDPPPPSTVRQRITDDLGNVLRETKAASQGATANLPGTSSFTQLGGSSSTMLRALEPVTRLVASRPKNLGLTDPTSGFDVDATIKFLNEQLFTDANYIGDGIYKVPPSLICSTEVVAPDGTVTQSVDPDCAAKLEQVQLRIRVEDNSGRLDFAVQIDKDHDEPLTVGLAHTELSLTVNLDDAGHAMVALAQLAGETAPNAALSGQVTGALKILGAAHAQVSLAFDRAISVKVADQGASLDSDSAARFTSAAAHVFEVELDGNAANAKLDVGLGETTIHTPSSASTASTDIDLAGVSFGASATAGKITITDIALGTKTTTVMKGGALAQSIDLNPDSGRTLDATITADAATGVSTLTVVPKLDLRTFVDHTVLGDSPDQYDVTRVLLDGSLSGVDGSNVVKVATGSFSITTNPAQYGFSATAGQCVTSTDVYDQISGNTYTQFSVAACQ